MKLRWTRLAAALGSLALCAVAVCARSTSGDRLALVTDEKTDVSSLQAFLTALQERGYQVEHLKGGALDLTRHDVRRYDHLVLAGGKMGDKARARQVVDFLRLGGNAIVVLGTAEGEGSAAHHDLLSQFSLALRPGERLYDNIARDSGKSGTLVLEASTGFSSAELAVNERVLGQAVIRGGPIRYSGPALTIKEENSRLIPLLRANPTSYSAGNSSRAPSLSTASGAMLTGSQAIVAAGFQTDVNSRITFLGSLDLLQQTTTNNVRFIQETSKWTFGEKGVLRVDQISHRSSELGELGESDPKSYRVKDDITYTASFSEWDGSQWTPFEADDIQLAFTMLDPHYRVSLHPAERHPSSRVYRTSFKAPSRYGVFTFDLTYRRPGLSFLSDHRTVAVRPFRHDEYERFIPTAYPYYVGAASTMASFLLLCVAWLGYEPGKKGKG